MSLCLRLHMTGFRLGGNKEYNTDIKMFSDEDFEFKPKYAIYTEERNKVTTVRWGMQMEKVLNLPCEEGILKTVDTI